MISLYKRVFVHKFFNKIFITYTLVAISAIIIIAYLASLNIDISLKNREAENNSTILANVNTYFEQKIASSRNIAENIYITNSLHSEIVYLMNNGYNKHLQYKYDKLLSSPETKYNGFESYFNSCLNRDSNITGICIYSSTQPKAYVYSNTGRTIYNKNSTITKYINDQPESPQGILIIPSHRVNYRDDNDSSLAFSVVYQIKDTFSSDICGYITIDYATTGIKSEFDKYSADYKGIVIILTAQGDTIFDSSETYYNSVYPFYNSLIGAKDSSNLYLNNIINTAASVDSSTLAAAILPKQIIKDENSSGRKILLISLACIAATLLLSFITMLTFSKRIGSLMSGIKNVDSGDFSSRITVKNKHDEISEIANSFNSMCDNINEYIEKVYVSDIKQKQSQLKALQAQINPHFLYNTLESIRMRALVNGSKDVAEMIYLLSSLFRNSIKKKNIINIREEIKYCKMYLELFNMRFVDNIKVTIDFKEEVMDFGIIKHCLQPLIENYIIHGIDTERPDNLLTIRGFEYEKYIYIYVIDNGSGIAEEKLIQIKQHLADPNLTKDSGLGLTNVNERIMLLFGSNYGLDIYSEQGKGTVVMLKLPAKTREELESNVQSVNS